MGRQGVGRGSGTNVERSRIGKERMEVSPAEGWGKEEMDEDEEDEDKEDEKGTAAWMRGMTFWHTLRE